MIGSDNQKLNGNIETNLGGIKTVPKSDAC